MSCAEKLNEEAKALNLQIQEMESTTYENIPSDSKFDIIQDLLSMFYKSIGLLE